MVLFYRGAWCPYRNTQLRAFQRASATLADAGVQVVALSVDDEVATAGLIAKNGLTFPVGFGADARAAAGLTGAFVSPDPVYLRSTGFVLDPAGKVVVSVYQRGRRPAGPRRRRRAGALRARVRRNTRTACSSARKRCPSGPAISAARVPPRRIIRALSGSG